MQKKIQHIPILFVMIVWMLSSLACEETPALTGASGSPGPGAVLFADDFSKSSGGWGTWNQDGTVVGYDSGALNIQVNTTQYDFWSVSGKSYADVVIDVDATKRSGPDDNDFGIICRYQSSDNFYMLVISSDGYYGIAKMKDGQYRMISADQLQYNEAIAKGAALNHLQATCSGSTLSLSANGQPLASVEDADFKTGDVGMLAGAYDSIGVDILFDNFVVKNPTGQ